MTTEVQLLLRSLKVTLGLSILVALFGFYYIEPQWAFSYLVFSLFSLLNLYLWYRLGAILLLQRNKFTSVVLVLLKVPLIYGGIFLFCSTYGFELSSFLWGFNTVYIVVILKMTGRYIIGIEPGRE